MAKKSDRVLVRVDGIWRRGLYAGVRSGGDSSVCAIADGVVVKLEPGRWLFWDEMTSIYGFAFRVASDIYTAEDASSGGSSCCKKER